MHRLVISALILSMGLAAEVRAVDRHEALKVTPLKKSGKVVGFKWAMVLRPESYPTVRMLVGSMDAKGVTGDPPRRKLATGETPGYLRFELDKRTGLTSHKPQEADGTVIYGEGNDLKPGDKVDIYTVWNGPGSASYWHVFGMHEGPVNQHDMAFVVTLPGAEKEAPKEEPKPEQKP